MKLAELGEFGLIERIRQAGDASTAIVGIGDDCAAVEVPPGASLLTSTDLLIEDVHFRSTWTDYYDLGCKAVAVNVSDVAAMGGNPQAIFLGLGAPSEMSVEELEQLLSGVRDEARRYGAELLGGDTCRSSGGLMLGVTVQGYAPAEQLVRRSGAEVGDQIWVSGCLGDSALALRYLQRDEKPPEALARRHHRPEARVTLGRALAQSRLAKAMIDVSDGLLADLGHVLRASRLGGEVAVERLPLSQKFNEHVQQQPQDLELALRGGEDYELLFCSAAGRAAELLALAAQIDVPLTPIGRIRQAPGLDVSGLEEAGVTLVAQGFDHFSAPCGRT